MTTVEHQLFHQSLKEAHATKVLRGGMRIEAEILSAMEALISVTDRAWNYETGSIRVQNQELLRI